MQIRVLYLVDTYTLHVQNRAFFKHLRAFNVNNIVDRR